MNATLRVFVIDFEIYPLLSCCICKPCENEFELFLKWC